MSKIAQNFPLIATPLTDGQGNISQAWMQFLMSLWGRTGQAPGIDLQKAADDAANALTATVLLKAPAYVTVTANPTLANERVLAGGTGLTLTDGGAGGNIALALANTAVAAGNYGSASKTVSFGVDAQGRLIAAAEYALSTSNIAEGTNLYYTDARARAALFGGTGISYNGGTGAIALDSASNRNVDHAAVSVTAGAGLTGGGDLTATRTLAIDSTVATLTGTQTLTNKTLTGPLVSGAGYVNGAVRIARTDGTASSFGIGGDGAGGAQLYDRNAGDATRYICTSTGAHQFVSASTTASAANAFLDNTTSNTLLRSTSSLQYKTDIEPMDRARAWQIVTSLKPIWYRSTAEADRKDWSWYGLGAEDVALVDPRLTHWSYPVVGEREESFQVDEETTVMRMVPVYGADLVPDGVQYERICTALLIVVQDMATRLEAVEAKIAA